MNETLQLLESVSTVHGSPAADAAARLRAAMELMQRHAEEGALHPELAKERYTLKSSLR